MRTRITKRAVDAAKPQTHDAYIWDDELRGFGVRITPKGARVYFVRAMRDGKRVFVRLGEHGVLTPTQARDKAAEALSRIARGENPTAERREAIRKAREPKPVPPPPPPTVRDLAGRFLREHLEPRRKPSYIRCTRTCLDLHILPKLGGLAVPAVTTEHVEALHMSLQATPYNANRCLAALSKMFSLAERWNLRPRGSNPCRGIEKFTEHKRERFLSELELRRLAKALDDAERDGTESPHPIAAIRLLIFTGARVGEILGLRWEHVDWDRGCLRLPDSKTGAKVVHLFAPALELLRERGATADTTGWVIPGGKSGQPWANLKAPWGRIRNSAGLEGVRLHDLRHTFASYAAGEGVSLPVIGRLLGHTQPATTARYAHLADSPLRDAGERTAERLRAAMERDTPELQAVK